MTRIDVIFDAPDASPYREPTLAAVGHAVATIGIDATVRVVPTATITAAYHDDLPHGVLIGPGTPYASPHAAEGVIRSARERGLPLVAT